MRKLLATLAFGAFCAEGQDDEGIRRKALIVQTCKFDFLGQCGLPGVAQDKWMKTLSQAGFQTTKLEDLGLQDLVKKVNAYFQDEVDEKTVLFLQLSGLGVQASNTNFLFSRDFDPKAQGTLNSRAVSVLRLLQDLEDRKPYITIVNLDLAEQNPAVMSLASGLGLRLEEEYADLKQTLILFPTAPNQPLPSSISDRGQYYDSLSAAMSTPGMDLGRICGTLQEDVEAKTQSRMRPRCASTATRKFEFRAAVKVEPVTKIVERTIEKPVEVDVFQRVSQMHRLSRQEYRYVPKGKFLMGCVLSDNEDDRCEANEKPQHLVEISKGFWMGVTEVTYREWERFALEEKQGGRKRNLVRTINHKDESPDHPVVGVAWEDAQAFCNWVGGRLPTEAEWEYAARAGQEGRVYPFEGKEGRDKANFIGKRGNDRDDTTARVKSYDPNAWGLFDMAGNVWELNSDHYAGDYYAHSPTVDPKGPEKGRGRVRRGGSFYSDPKKHLRISYRAEFEKASNMTGFRCVIEDSPLARENFAR